MTDDARGSGTGPETADDGGDRDEGTERTRKGPREKVGDGFKQGIGVLSAFRDAVEETIQEARERGDLSAEKAREVMKEALERAAQAGERARDRLDFASHAELASLRDFVDGLRRRVTDLEAEVFGASREPEGPGDEGSGEAGDEAGDGTGAGADPA